MASIRRFGERWRAEVYRRGVRRSKVLATKAAALAWAREAEAQIDAGTVDAGTRTVADLLREYARRVSATKRGKRWEEIRISLLCRDPIAELELSRIDAPDIANWRDRRLAEVSAATVSRDWTLLSHAFSVAVREWKWLTRNPMIGVRRPPKTPPRDRIFTDAEVDRLLHAAGSDLSTVTGRVGAALRIALETGMRAGELCTLTWARVSLERGVARLERTKNGDSREVPLTVEAVRVLSALPKAPDDDRCLRLSSSQLDALFRKLKARAMVTGATFHDSRATAITRLALRLDILALARMIGHRDLRSLQVYYRESAEEIARRLNARKEKA